MVFIFLIVGLLLGLSTHALYLNAQDTAESSPDLEEENGQNVFLSGLVFIIGMVLIWFLLHKLLYSLLLRYYHPSYCKELFWSLLMLYGLAWVTIGSYVLFDVGFKYGILKWVFVFLGIIWIIWFLVIMFKKDKAY
jgi:hypothetical protein